MTGDQLLKYRPLLMGAAALISTSSVAFWQIGQNDERLDKLESERDAVIEMKTKQQMILDVLKDINRKLEKDNE